MSPVIFDEYERPPDSDGPLLSDQDLLDLPLDCVEALPMELLRERLCLPLFCGETRLHFATAVSGEDLINAVELMNFLFDRVAIPWPVSRSQVLWALDWWSGSGVNSDIVMTITD